MSERRPDGYLTVKEAAERVGVSTQTLRRWDKQGKLSPSRHPINNYRVYSISQIDQLVKSLEPDYGSLGLTITEGTVKPRFETSRGQLYQGDASEIMKTFPANSIDLVFADPPYNIRKAQWDTFSSQKEYIDWSLDWITQAHRLLKDNGSLYVCGFSEILADIKWAASHMFTGCKWLVWYYRNKANLSNDWGRSHESILHFRKSREFTFNIDEVRVPYNKHTLRYPQHPQAQSSQYGNGKSYVWSPNPKGAKPKDVFEIPTISNNGWERYDHPTQKPVELLKKVILASSNPDDTVLDPFGGSGTTYAVSEAFGRDWVGIELETEYCELIEHRLKDTDHITRIAEREDDKESRERREKLRG
jgi:site-specific DNA-methyltransferase (adenine-specific)